LWKAKSRKVTLAVNISVSEQPFSDVSFVEAPICFSVPHGLQTVVVTLGMQWERSMQVHINGHDKILAFVLS